METLSMSDRERRRLAVFSRVREGQLSVAEGGRQLGLSYRQAKRLWRRYQEQGDRGLVHGLRGVRGNRRSELGLRERALSRYQQQYADYGPTLAAECLAREDGVVVPVSTLRRWLREAGLWTRRRQREPHRRRRPRRERRGELVQLDGSYHDWFEGRRGWGVLMVMIDDATGVIYARFFEAETQAAAFETFRRYVLTWGVPGALYVDRSSIYRSDREATAEELLSERRPETQFGRAMRELQVELILARSPQAKGRVERVNGTLQDRLVKAMRRAGISDLERANRFLEEEFLGEFNARFARAAEDEGDGHRRLARGSAELDVALSQAERRVVQHDWTVRWRNRFLQLPSSTASRVQPGQAVEVREQWDGRLRVFAGGEEVAWEEVRAFVERGGRRREGKGVTGSVQGRKPSAQHPWRHAPVGAARRGSSASSRLPERVEEVTPLVGTAGEASVGVPNGVPNGVVVEDEPAARDGRRRLRRARAKSGARKRSRGGCCSATAR